ncbi:radial spoke head 14 [Willisornis vidua]|uniref:Radial spoke head 14 n=1 Tax=Willisornis vidua TaxID=1566151 RepID=A0ABQ9DMQ4_9PASS|nr:radial spoke head 14 [Willisornis vidua]
MYLLHLQLPGIGSAAESADATETKFRKTNIKPGAGEAALLEPWEMLWLPWAGAAGVLQAGLVPPLVLKVKTELDEVVELILATLCSCLRVEASVALAAGAVAVLKEKLTHPSAAIRSKAASVLLEISSHPEGKIAVCEEDVIPVLVSLLEDTDPEVQASAAGALMFAMVTPQGRSWALGAEALPALLRLVGAGGSPARLNALRALALLAELPAGRAALQEHTGTVRQRLRDPSRAVQRAALSALRAIEWKPFCSRDLF